MKDPIETLKDHIAYNILLIILSGIALFGCVVNEIEFQNGLVFQLDKIEAEERIMELNDE